MARSTIIPNFASKNVLYQAFVKPLGDKVAGFITLLLFSPVMLGVVLALALTNRGKVWFVQKRPGRNGKIFTLIKFRTMTEERDASGHLLDDKQRLTRLGKWIRRSSLDELPQLINVVAGSMSIVGPRPLLVQYLPLYNSHQKKRHLVKPGITGWAQVNGRNSIGWQQKFNYDVWYVENISFSLDVKILFLTVIRVFKAEGISAVDHPTMKNFTGN